MLARSMPILASAALLAAVSVTTLVWSQTKLAEESPSGDRARPHVVLITVDTLRAWSATKPALLPRPPLAGPRWRESAWSGLAWHYEFSD